MGRRPAPGGPVGGERGGLPRGRGDAGGVAAGVPPALLAPGFSVLRSAAGPGGAGGRVRAGRARRAGLPRRRRSGSGRPAERCWSGRSRRWSGEENRWYSLLDIALDHLTLGRAHLGLALPETAPLDLPRPSSTGPAVDGLRRAGTGGPPTPRLLARAALRRFRSDFAGAAADLTEALEIAERGPMRLHECDAHLEWARLCRDQGDLAGARRHVARARVLVDETGYGRRVREVAWLEGVLGKG